MGRPIHFEILGDDPAKLATFYEETLGWTFQTWQGEAPYWLVTTGSTDLPGINGGMMTRHFPQAVINTVQVDSIEATVEKVEKAGGKKVHGPNEIPGVGLHAYCEDPEGNMFGILQPKSP